MRLLFTATLIAAFATITHADDKKGTTVEWGGLKSTAPASWKEGTPTSRLRKAQFKLPKAEGDTEDCEVAIFELPGGGSVQQNLERQEKIFEIPAGKKPEDAIKIEKIKLGANAAVYQDIQGTLLKKFPPNDPNAKVTKVADSRQLYIVFEAKEGDATVTYSLWLRGPAKSVEKNKKAFDEWIKNFK